MVLWGTEFGASRIFAFWPRSGLFKEYSLPHAYSGVGCISVEPATDDQTRVWSTETTRNVNGELVYDPTAVNAALYEDSFPAAVGGGAYAVYALANSVWFAGFSPLVRWDWISQQYTVWSLPTHGSALGRPIAIDANHDVWYTQGSSNATIDDNYVACYAAVL